MTLEMVLGHESREDLYLRVLVPHNRIAVDDVEAINDILMNEFDFSCAISF